jgi:hypothetical protein
MLTDGGALLAHPAERSEEPSGRQKRQCRPSTSTVITRAVA